MNIFRSDSGTSRRISPHSVTTTKQTNGSSRHGHHNQRSMHTENPPLMNNDDEYKKLDSSMSVFRENGSILKPDLEENTQIVKHFVPSIDRYHLSQNVPEKPIFRGPETDVLHDLEKDKLKSIRIQMIRADVQQTDSYRKAYVVEDHVPRVKGENHEHVDDRKTHLNPNPVHYDHVENCYGLSPCRQSHDCSLSPLMNNRPPSPPLPYSPNLDCFVDPDSVHRESRSLRSENFHGRASKKRHENFLEHPSPEPRSPSTSRYRTIDNRHHTKNNSMRYDSHPRRSDSSPVYYEKRCKSFRSPSPTNRTFSPNERSTRRSALSPPRNVSSSLKQQTSNDHPRKRRSPPQRYDRSRDRRRRNSPRRRTPPIRSTSKRRDNNDHHKKRSTSRNRDVRRRENRENRRRSQSKSNSPQQEEQQSSYSSSQPQSGYSSQPGVRIPPPRPYPGPMLIPLRPPLYPPPMGAWRPPRPPLQAPPPAGWPYPRPRPLYYPY
ncbi:serine/arginine repetitive matrix protein 1-like isoform X2 [Daktulosphaira vitifoliae]|uniref:serine/arginine repetitive matrix protein 1-like isoform X2 n=1 Tax=Daktulosphaira vitifoliae TaxID=58002 RepID=UPI0021AA3347|nr:serine/arginine repetitive matrix protein 1-like isoform X2 [Daktulosphaira vitifoliae]